MADLWGIEVGGSGKGVSSGEDLAGLGAVGTEPIKGFTPASAMGSMADMLKEYNQQKAVEKMYAEREKKANIEKIKSLTFGENEKNEISQKLGYKWDELPYEQKLKEYEEWKNNLRNALSEYNADKEKGFTIDESILDKRFEATDKDQQEQIKAPERSWGEWAGQLGGGIAKGALQGGALLAKGVDLLADTDTAGQFKRWTDEAFKDIVTNPVQEDVERTRQFEMHQLKQRVDKGEVGKVESIFKEMGIALSNADLSFLAEQLGQQVVTMPLGVIGSKAGQLIARGVVGKTAEEAVKWAEKSGKLTERTLGFLMNGADAADSAGEIVKTIPLEELQKLPGVQEIAKKHKYDWIKVRDEIARDAEKEAYAANATITTALSMLPGTGSLTRSMGKLYGRIATGQLGKSIASAGSTNILKAVGKGVIGGAIEEGVEEGVTQGVANVSAIRRGAQRDVIQEVPTNVALGALMGAGMGGVSNIVTSRADNVAARIQQNNERIEQAKREKNAQRLEELKAEQAKLKQIQDAYTQSQIAYQEARQFSTELEALREKARNNRLTPEEETKLAEMNQRQTKRDELQAQLDELFSRVLTDDDVDSIDNTTKLNLTKEDNTLIKDYANEFGVGLVEAANQYLNNTFADRIARRQAQVTEAQSTVSLGSTPLEERLNVLRQQQSALLTDTTATDRDQRLNNIATEIQQVESELASREKQTAKVNSILGKLIPEGTPIESIDESFLSNALRQGTLSQDELNTIQQYLTTAENPVNDLRNIARDRLRGQVMSPSIPSKYSKADTTAIPTNEQVGVSPQMSPSARGAFVSITNEELVQRREEARKARTQEQTSARAQEQTAYAALQYEKDSAQNKLDNVSDAIDTYFENGQDVPDALFEEKERLEQDVNELISFEKQIRNILSKIEDNNGKLSSLSAREHRALKDYATRFGKGKDVTDLVKEHLASIKPKEQVTLGEGTSTTPTAPTTPTATPTVTSQHKETTKQSKPEEVERRIKKDDDDTDDKTPPGWSARTRTRTSSKPSVPKNLQAAENNLNIKDADINTPKDIVDRSSIDVGDNSLVSNTAAASINVTSAQITLANTAESTIQRASDLNNSSVRENLLANAEKQKAVEVHLQNPALRTNEVPPDTEPTVKTSEDVKKDIEEKALDAEGVYEAKANLQNEKSINVTHELYNEAKNNVTGDKRKQVQQNLIDSGLASLNEEANKNNTTAEEVLAIANATEANKPAKVSVTVFRLQDGKIIKTPDKKTVALAKSSLSNVTQENVDITAYPETELETLNSLITAVEREIQEKVKAERTKKSLTAKQKEKVVSKKAKNQAEAVKNLFPPLVIKPLEKAEVVITNSFKESVLANFGKDFKDSDFIEFYNELIENKSPDEDYLSESNISKTKLAKKCIATDNFNTDETLNILSRALKSDEETFHKESKTFDQVLNETQLTKKQLIKQEETKTGLDKAKGIIKRFFKPLSDILFGSVNSDIFEGTIYSGAERITYTSSGIYRVSNQRVNRLLDTAVKNILNDCMLNGKLTLTSYIKMVSNLKHPKNNNIQCKGYYDPNADVILIDSNAGPEVLAHEILHALTIKGYKVLQYLSEHGDKEAKAFASEKLKFISDTYNELNARTNGVFKGEGSQLQNVFEMLANVNDVNLSLTLSGLNVGEKYLARNSSVLNLDAATVGDLASILNTQLTNVVTTNSQDLIMQATRTAILANELDSNAVARDFVNNFYQIQQDKLNKIRAIMADIFSTEEKSVDINKRLASMLRYGVLNRQIASILDEDTRTKLGRFAKQVIEGKQVDKKPSELDRATKDYRRDLIFALATNPDIGFTFDDFYEELINYSLESRQGLSLKQAGKLTRETQQEYVGSITSEDVTRENLNEEQRKIHDEFISDDKKLDEVLKILRSSFPDVFTKKEAVKSEIVLKLAKVLSSYSSEKSKGSVASYIANNTKDVVKKALREDIKTVPESTHRRAMHINDIRNRLIRDGYDGDLTNAIVEILNAENDGRGYQNQKWNAKRVEGLLKDVTSGVTSLDEALSSDEDGESTLEDILPGTNVTPLHELLNDETKDVIRNAIWEEMRNPSSPDARQNLAKAFLKFYLGFNNKASATILGVGSSTMDNFVNNLIAECNDAIQKHDDVSFYNTNPVTYEQAMNSITGSTQEILNESDMDLTVGDNPIRGTSFNDIITLVESGEDVIASNGIDALKDAAKMNISSRKGFNESTGRKTVSSWLSNFAQSFRTKYLNSMSLFDDACDNISKAILNERELFKEGVSDSDLHRGVAMLQHAPRLAEGLKRDFLNIINDFAPNAGQVVADVADALKINRATVEWFAGWYATANWSIKQNERLLEKLEQKAKTIKDPEAKQELEEYIYSFRNAFESSDQGNPSMPLASGMTRQQAERMMKAAVKKLGAENINKVLAPTYRQMAIKLALDIQSGKADPTTVGKFLNRQDLVQEMEALQEVAKLAESDNTYVRQLNEVRNKLAEKLITEYVPLIGDAFNVENIAVNKGQPINAAIDRALRGTFNVAMNGLDATRASIYKSATYYSYAPLTDAIDYLMTKVKPENLSKLGLYRNKVGFNNGVGITVRRADGFYDYTIGDESVMQQLRKQNIKEISELTKKIGKLTSAYSSGITRWTLLFAPKNMVQDAMERSATLALNFQNTYDMNGNKVDMAKVSNDMLKLLTASLAPGYGIDGLFKAGWNIDNLNSLPDSEAKFLLESLVKHGGLSHARDLFKGGATLGDAAPRNNALAKGWRAMRGVVESWNNSFDIAPVLATYKALLDANVDHKIAAGITRATMDFDKIGSEMNGIKALWTFAQPAFTGGGNMIKFLTHGTNAQRMQALKYLMPRFVALGLIAMITRSIAGDDDDGGNRIDNLSKMTKNNNLLFRVGDTFFKLPIGYGWWRVMNTAIQGMIATAKGEESAIDSIKDFFGHTIGEISPIQAPDYDFSKAPLLWVTDTFGPTLAKPLIHLVANKNAFGGFIVNEKYGDKNVFRSDQYGKRVPEGYRAMAQFIRRGTGNIVDFAPEEMKFFLDQFPNMLFLQSIRKVAIDAPYKASIGEKTLGAFEFVNQFTAPETINGIRSQYFDYMDYGTYLRKRENSGEELKPLEKRMLKELDKQEAVVKQANSDRSKLTKNKSLSSSYRDKKFKEIEMNQHKQMIKAVGKFRNIFLLGDEP